MISLRTSPAFSARVVVGMKDTNQSKKVVKACNEVIDKYNTEGFPYRHDTDTKVYRSGKSVVFDNPNLCIRDVNNFKYRLILDAEKQLKEKAGLNDHEFGCILSASTKNSKLYTPYPTV